MAEARGKAQADALRKTKTDTIAKRVVDGGRIEVYTGCAAGDVVTCAVGDIIPGDGEVIDGIATVDESVITGESAPGDSGVRGRSKRRHRRDQSAFGSNPYSNHVKSW